MHNNERNDRIRLVSCVSDLRQLPFPKVCRRKRLALDRTSRPDLAAMRLRRWTLLETLPSNAARPPPADATALVSRIASSAATRAPSVAGLPT
jgi:hypothetical protein